MGKFLGLVIVLSAIIAGGALYYLQIYHFYETVEPTGEGDVKLTIAEGAPEPLAHTDFQAIDAASSPIRYRACFSTPVTSDALAALYAPYPRAEPRNAPGWFECFDADAIAEALKSGIARAYLGEGHLEYGIDRVVAITEAGQGFVWHQINPCGHAAFDGNPVPEGCPPPPERP
ncbi:MAG: DUF6446 family protein [Pseudomonadota bacterium]